MKICALNLAVEVIKLALIRFKNVCLYNLNQNSCHSRFVSLIITLFSGMFLNLGNVLLSWIKWCSYKGTHTHPHTPPRVLWLEAFFLEIYSNSNWIHAYLISLGPRLGRILFRGEGEKIVHKHLRVHSILVGPTGPSSVSPNAFHSPPPPPKKKIHNTVEIVAFSPSFRTCLPRNWKE